MRPNDQDGWIAMVGWSEAIRTAYVNTMSPTYGWAHLVRKRCPAIPMATFVTWTRWRLMPTLAHAENVNTTVVVVTRGADGKLYPARALSGAERNRARWLAHNLVHRDGLSIRRARRVMAEQYGVRRSVGIIARDLWTFSCPRCE